jgi:hypothetical protein
MRNSNHQPPTTGATPNHRPPTTNHQPPTTNQKKQFIGDKSACEG